MLPYKVTFVAGHVAPWEERWRRRRAARRLFRDASKSFSTPPSETLLRFSCCATSLLSMSYSWMSDRSEFREALSGDALPITERRHLSVGDRRSRDSVEVLFPLGQSLDERGSSRLAVRSKCEEDLLEDAVPLVRWILQMFREPRLFEVHDVFTAARGSADQDQAPKDHRNVQHHLLGDHSAKRESEHVARPHAETIEESGGMLRHVGNGRRH